MSENLPSTPSDPAGAPPGTGGWVPDVSPEAGSLIPYGSGDRLPAAPAQIVYDLVKAAPRDGRSDTEDVVVTGVPVNPPEPPPSPWALARSGARRPVMPTWLRSWAALRSAARWFAGYCFHTALFHAVRLPFYAAVLVWRAPRGLGRATTGAAGWLTDAETRPARATAIRREETSEYLRLAKLRDARVRVRTIVAIAAGLPTIAAFTITWMATPPAVHLAILAILVGVLGMLGAPADRPLVGPAVTPTKVGRLTADIVVRALESLGIAEINKARREGGGITFPAPITRDGPGWRADVDLPYGVTVSDILDRRERLASGLRRPLGCVWPEAVHDAHAGRLVLWVGDEDMSAAPAAEWPLARRGTADVFAPLPFGSDARGRPVAVLLPENNVLVGSLPGAGKTSAVRVLLLACGLDPTCEVWVYNLKGTGDLDSAEKFAHRYVTGIDDASIEAALVALRDLRAEVVRRATALKNLPKDLCPDGKVTRALANRRSLGLHLLVAFFDECQNLFTHPVYGEEAGTLATDVIKLGRALGVVLVLATQRPDANSLPTGVSSSVSVRFCLRVMGQVENDMILGTSMYKNGVRATTLRPTDKGIGYLVGATDDPLIVRAAYIDTPTAEKVADRARAARIQAGTLAGIAAGETPPEPTERTSTILDDVLAVLPASETKVWSETIVARLAELRPDAYTGWGAEQLTVALKPYGISPGQVWGTAPGGKGANRRGIERQQIVSAITDRSRSGGGG
ncbi:DNA segregation ATPase FtsK/SpoIIIE, S-DNA-T family [Parafrankia irregularis]|uniref:DNA segregation ATPase FtsK/SpoIIIE, S-DNA-T family n=1 Tax=Parafrankia irregularis TaxID=795642 RepID=A0A0S4QKR5_9ACTN|nr:MULTISPECIES: cell division protein FtsK [Parafrankia]MBE3205713.1 cell division protein FtsK [Parafrankia sp. CH37]CUU55388.1 DNA segregation ATPase FtsK/SpoIIIE, S-DNA-T family [Parafrankia irregularis]